MAKTSRKRKPAAKKKAVKKNKKKVAPRKKTAAKKTRSKAAAKTRAVRKKPAKKSNKKKAARKKTPVRKKVLREKQTPKPAKKPEAPVRRPTHRPRIGTFEELIADHLPEVQETARRLRAMVFDVLPEAVETVYLGWRIAIYREPREICGIQPVRGRCNFYLTDGAHLSDPDGLLTGGGKNIRHVKIFEPGAIPLDGLKRLIREGHRLALEGLLLETSGDEGPAEP